MNSDVKTDKKNISLFKRKQSFKDAVSGASFFIKCVRYAFMTISVLETIIAFVFWITMLMPKEVLNLTKYFFLGMNILPYIIPAMTLALIILFIVLCVDAVETKTEIKIRAIFIMLSIMPVLMTWNVVLFKWIQVLKK